MMYILISYFIIVVVVPPRTPPTYRRYIDSGDREAVIQQRPLSFVRGSINVFYVPFIDQFVRGVLVIFLAPEKFHPMHKIGSGVGSCHNKEYNKQ